MGLNNCTLCQLSETRKKVVRGYGGHSPLILFIGEAPGKDEENYAGEDGYGKPFVGRAGKIFDQIVRALGLSSKEYYVTNVIKCRPTEGNKNRQPTEEEISACSLWLEEEMKLLKPKLVILLGATALKSRLGLGKVSEKRGVFYPAPRESDDTMYFVMFHPAAAIYDQEGTVVEKIKEDILRLKPYLRRLRETCQDIL